MNVAACWANTLHQMETLHCWGSWPYEEAHRIPRLRCTFIWSLMYFSFTCIACSPHFRSYNTKSKTWINILVNRIQAINITGKCVCQRRTWKICFEMNRRRCYYRNDRYTGLHPMRCERECCSLKEKIDLNTAQSLSPSLGLPLLLETMSPGLCVL